jgi:hypothetical protein
MNPKDIVGEKFNQLKVIKFLESKPRKSGTAGSKKYFYLCECDCGNETRVDRSYLKCGHTKSCGCLKKIKGKDNVCWTGYEDISGRMWYAIKCKAKERNLIFSISIEDAWKQYEKQDGRCALTGCLLSLDSPFDDLFKKTASLDRIDNDRGYEADNIQWLHKDVNWMKGRFSTERFLEICQQVAEHKGDILC